MSLDTERIEVIISEHHNGYKATSPSFPGCKGIGENEKVALTKLSQSIGRFVARMTRSSMDQVFQSDQYTEVLTGDMEDTSRRWLFHLNTNTQESKKIVMKMKPYHDVDDSILSNFLSKVGTSPSDKQPSFSSVGDIDMQSLLINMPYQEEKEEGFTFGFPISFN